MGTKDCGTREEAEIVTTTHAKQVTGTPRKVSSSGTQTELKTQPRLSLAGAIHSEWIKASSLRSIRWTAAVSIVVGIAMSVVMAFAIRDLVGQDSAAGYIDYLLTVTGFPATFLSLVFGVLGVFVFSNEYSSGMILSTLTAAPRRGIVRAAKAVVLTAASAVIAVIVVAGGVAISVALMPDVWEVLGDTQALTGLAGTLFFLVGISLLSFALAGIIRSTAGAITAVVGILLMAPLILQIVSGLVDWTWVVTVQNYLPMNLGSTLSFGLTESVPMRTEMEQADTGYGSVPTYWQASVAFIAWIALPMIACVKAFFARDAQ